MGQGWARPANYGNGAIQPPILDFEHFYSVTDISLVVAAILSVFWDQWYSLLVDAYLHQDKSLLSGLTAVVPMPASNIPTTIKDIDYCMLIQWCDLVNAIEKRVQDASKVASADEESWGQYYALGDLISM